MHFFDATAYTNAHETAMCQVIEYEHALDIYVGLQERIQCQLSANKKRFIQ